MLYKALIVEGLHRPLESLARGLREREAELSAVAAERAAILDHASDAIIATDLDMRVTAWNEAATRIYGWTQEETRGRTVDDLLGTEFVGQSREEARAELVSSDRWRCPTIS